MKKIFTFLLTFFLTLATHTNIAYSQSASSTRFNPFTGAKDYTGALSDYTGTLTDGKFCTYDSAGEEIDCVSDFVTVSGSCADINKNGDNVEFFADPANNCTVETDPLAAGDKILVTDVSEGSNATNAFTAGTAFTGGIINLDTTNFDNSLSAADTNVQLALDTLDESVASAGVVDDSAGDGDTAKTWSADKLVQHIIGTSNEGDISANDTDKAIVVASISAASSTTKLWLQHDDVADASTTFTDSSTTGHTVTANGDAQVNTAVRKFNIGGSGVLDGTGDYLQVGDSAEFDLGSSWILETWVYLLASPSGETVIMARTDEGNSEYSWKMYFDGSTSLELDLSSDGTTYTNFARSKSFQTDRWYHVGFTGNGSTVSSFIDGVLESEGAWTATIQDVTDPLYIGAKNTTGSGISGELNAHLDELRVVNGSVRNSSFTPAPVPYTTSTQYAYGPGRWDLDNFVDLDSTQTITGSKTMNILTVPDSGQLVIPDGNSETVTGDGEIAIDSSITDYMDGYIIYQANSTDMKVVAIPLGDGTPTDGHVLKYNATNDDYEFVADTDTDTTYTASDGVQLDGTNIELDIPSLTEYTGIESADMIVFRDDSAGDYKKISVTSLGGAARSSNCDDYHLLYSDSAEDDKTNCDSVLTFDPTDNRLFLSGAAAVTNEAILNIQPDIAEDGINITGVASYSGNFFEAQDNSNVDMFTVGPDGDIYGASQLSIGDTNTDHTAQISSGSAQYAVPALNILPSSHATSQRATMGFGCNASNTDCPVIGRDWGGIGTDNFYMYNATANKTHYITDATNGWVRLADAGDGIVDHPLHVEVSGPSDTYIAEFENTQASDGWGVSVVTANGNDNRDAFNVNSTDFKVSNAGNVVINKSGEADYAKFEVVADADTIEAAGHDWAIAAEFSVQYGQGGVDVSGQTGGGTDLYVSLRDSDDIDNSDYMWMGLDTGGGGSVCPSGTNCIVSSKGGTGTTRDMRLLALDDSINGTSQITLKANQAYVGINQTNPTVALDIVGDIQEASNFLWDSATETLVVGDSGGGYDNEPTVEAFRNDTALLGDTTNSGVVIALSNQSTGDAFIKAAGSGGGDSGILIESSNGVGWAIGQDNSDGDKLKINNATNSLTSDVTMTIDGTKVGIGTESPTSELHVETATSSVITINSSGSGAAGRSVFQLLRGGTTGWDWSTNNDTDSTDDFAIRQLGGVNDQVEYFRIVPDGNITIGNFTYDADQSVGAGQDNYVLTYDHGTGLISLEASGGGSGDVVGPASATDNAIARFDTTTGKLIQNSVVTIDDTGNMAGVVLDDFDNTIHADGIHTRVINNSGVTINKGEPVYISGYDATNDLSEVAKADADDANKMPCIGLMASNTTNGSTGGVTSFGNINSIDTSSWSVGDSIYVDTTAGDLTNVRPTGATTNVQKIAVVKKSDISNGILLVMGAYRSNDVSNQISDAVFRLHDNGDSTKLVDFQLSGLTTATTRTLTVQDASGTIALVGDNLSAFTNDSGFITATLTQEQVEDYAGGLVSNATGTHTGITITYQDATGDMDFVVSDTTVAGDTGSTGMTPGDTLTIAGGSGITTAMSGDTLTITASGGGGSGTMTTVKEAGVQVGGADIVAIDFGAGFDLSESPDTEVNIVLDYTEDPVDLGTAEVTGTLDVSDHVNLTAGRSLTLTGDDVLADAELYTHEKSVYIETPAVEKMWRLFGRHMSNATITYVYCETDAGTVTIDPEDGSSQDILTAGLVCDTNGQTSCSSGCDVNTISGTYDNITAKAEEVSLDITAVSSATVLNVTYGYTIDD